MALNADHERHARGADVGGMREHLRHAQHAMRGVEIVDGEAPRAQALARVDMRAERDLAGIERHRDGERLEGRAHFVGADVDAVDLGPVGLFGHVGRIVGIEVGQRFERDHFAGVDVENGARRRLRLEPLHARDEFVAQRVLGLEIKRQLDRLQRRRIKHEARHMRIGQALAVEIFLHARNADIVLIDEAQHMRAQRSVGIDALVFRPEADAGQPETVDLVLLLGGDLALDPDKALLRVETVAQFMRVDVGQHGGDEFDRLVLVDQVARFGEHRHGLDVGGEDIAVAVGEIGARAGGGLIGGRFQRLRLARKAEMQQLAANAEIGQA